LFILSDIIVSVPDPAKEPDLQTITVVGKALVTDDSTALLLGLFGRCVAYQGSLDDHMKKPQLPELDIAIQAWVSFLVSPAALQCAQAVLEELWQSYKSWLP